MRGGWRMAAPSRWRDPRTFLGAQSGGNDLVQQERRQGRSSPDCSSSTQQIFTAAGAALQRSTYWKRSCSATRHARTMIPSARSSSDSGSSAGSRDTSAVGCRRGRHFFTIPSTLATRQLWVGFSTTVEPTKKMRLVPY